ncbi:fimbrial protein, partial [Acinetobacter baumannii]|nr:fimbrial protein [Acinetobacter baumannii]EKU3490196.1 fimbrial protein [Acinetobacter baumannii]EKV6786162.1 fimbrial protein [Acinetobacter baumannii]EKV7320803.1 fimbrial protein [Acinetobacter baumannii]EKV7639563.1 fimbrial protein [Acinetobacter baumannii]
INGLNNIRFIDCNPQLSIMGTSSNTVDFGTIVPRASNVNTVVKRVPFTLSVALNNADSGGVCSGKTLMSTFTTPNTIKNQNTILATGRTDVGIQIFSKNATTPINMNTPVELGYINGAVTANSYDAGVLMLSTTPAPGDFSAIANVEITFK